MKTIITLVAKDTRLLARSPVVVAVLVIYPLLVALLAAAVMKGAEAPRRIAVVNNDTSGATVRVGDERIGIDQYLARLREEVDTEAMAAADARDALKSGDIDAVLTIPSGFISALSSGVQQPALELTTNPRAPVEGQAITRRLEAAVYRFNQSIAQRYVEQVVNLSDLIIRGGNLGVFGRQVDVIGLERSDALIRDVQGQARAQGRPQLAQQLEPLLLFIQQTRANLGLVRPAAMSIATPIALKTSPGGSDARTLSGFGVAAALLISVALASVLLGAHTMAQERQDGTLQRLRLAGVPTWTVALAKVVAAALAAIVLGLVFLGLVAAFTDVPVTRWVVWPLALAAAGAACGALGVAVASLIPDARGGVLVAVLASLPLMFVGLIPGRAIRPVADLIPFGRAFSVFRDLLAADAAVSGLLGGVAVLATSAAVLVAAAVFGVRRQADA